MAYADPACAVLLFLVLVEWFQILQSYMLLFTRPFLCTLVNSISLVSQATWEEETFPLLCSLGMRLRLYILCMLTMEES